MEKCLICGDTIPEGREVCPKCEREPFIPVRVDLSKQFNKLNVGLNANEKSMFALLFNNPVLFRLTIKRNKIGITDGQSTYYFDDKPSVLFAKLIHTMGGNIEYVDKT